MRNFAVAAMILMLAGMTAAQDAPEAKPTYTWKSEGDTVETFKTTLVVHQKVDQSTAKGAVEAFVGFTDWRDVTRKADTAASGHWKTLLYKALAPWEEKLLTANARQSLAKARDGEKAGGGMPMGMEPTKVGEETKAEDGTVLVETTQMVAGNRVIREGEPKPKPTETKVRYTCVKGEDGKWKVNKREARQRDWTAQEEKWEWKPETGPVTFYYVGMSKKAATAAEIKQDTPENAAMSVYTSLLAQRSVLETSVLEKGPAQLLLAIEALVTKDFIAEAEKAAAEFAKMVPEGGKAEIDSTTDDKDGAKLVTFKPLGKYRPPARVTLKQVDGKWLVAEAGVVEQKGGPDAPAEFRAMPDIYKLPKP